MSPESNIQNARRLSPKRLYELGFISLSESMNVSIFDDNDSLEWQDRALCKQTDPEAFFPEKGGSSREAKKVCTSCDVRAECLDYALKHDERFGIWGGLTERERRKLKRRAV